MQTTQFFPMPRSVRVSVYFLQISAWTKNSSGPVRPHLPTACVNALAYGEPCACLLYTSVSILKCTRPSKQRLTWHTGNNKLQARIYQNIKTPCPPGINMRCVSGSGNSHPSWSQMSFKVNIWLNLGSDIVGPKFIVRTPNVNIVILLVLGCVK